MRRESKARPARVVTTHLSCFGLQVKARQEQSLRALPLALEDGARVLECSHHAFAAGVREGQSLTQARLACPELVVLCVGEGELSEARRDVLEALLAVVPRVEWGGGGTFHADATGLERLHGSEMALVLRCCDALQRAGFTPRVACADTRLVASLAARTRSRPTVVPSGKHADVLDPLAVEMLPLREDVKARLGLLGVRTVGQFARLPSDGLADRFGREVARLQRLVRGEEPQPLLPLQDTPRPHATRELDEPVSGFEPVLFLLRSCCEELADDLERRGTAASSFELRFALDDPSGGSDARRIDPSRPITSSRALFDLCRLEIETRPVAAPLLGLGLLARDDVPAQDVPQELFARRLDAGRASAAVDRLRALLGKERVVTPAPRPAHRRELRVGWEPFDPDRACREPVVETRARPAGPTCASPARTPEGERILAQPLPAAVRLPLPPGRGGMPEGSHAMGAPGELVVPGTARAGTCALPEHVEIVNQVGPTRVTGEWWSGGADVDRDEYVLVGADGGLYRTCRDRRTKRWWLLGFLD